MHVTRSGNPSRDELPALGDYRTGCPEGGGIMPEVSWTYDKRVDGVTVIVETFRTTFVFGINSSGEYYGIGQLSDSQSGRGWFDVWYVIGGGRPTDSVFVFVIFF